MKNKPAKKFFENTNYSIKKCDEKGCTEDGNFVAPKSPNSKEKYFFCLKHIKLYNKRWNFFAGKSQAEIYNFQKNDFFEGKPTRPFSNGSASKIQFQFRYFFDKPKIKFRKKRKRFENSQNNSFNEQIENALETLDLDSNTNKEILKKKI